MLLDTILKISAPEPSEAQYAITNLITHLDSRTSGDGYKPLLDQLSNLATYDSCYRTTNVQLEPLGDKMIIKIDLRKPYFVHAMLIIQDLFDGFIPSHHNNINQFLQNLQFYIGNNEDYFLNPICPGGPYMVVDDYSKSYTSG